MSDPVVTVTLGRGKVARKRLSRPPTSTGLSIGKMYADQLEASDVSVKNRLGFRSSQSEDFGSVQPKSFTKILSKRDRSEVEKWEHDMYQPGTSTVKTTPHRDLRSKLNRKKLYSFRSKYPLKANAGGVTNSSTTPTPYSQDDPSTSSVDLREKLSGPKQVPKQVAATKPNNHPAQKKVTFSETKNLITAANSRPLKQPRIAPTNPTPTPVASRPPSTSPNPNSTPGTKKKQQTLPSFLESLDLGKYTALFLREEIDFPTLKNFKDEDLKELNIPMGPRKKILFALASQSS